MEAPHRLNLGDAAPDRRQAGSGTTKADVTSGEPHPFHLGSPNIRSVTAAQLQDLAKSVKLSMKDSGLEVADAVAGRDGMDLELMLGSLSAATSYAEAMGSSNVDIRGTSFTLANVRALRRDVNAVLAEACDLPRSTNERGLPPDPLQAHRSFLKRLLGARREGTPPIRIFTTNYDLVLERALEEAWIPYIDGFSGVYHRTFDPSMYELELHRPTGSSGHTRVHDALYVYKLHGSINWRVAAIGHRNSIVSHGASAISEDGDMALIYPTPHKEGEVLGFPYSDLMRALGDALMRPETALVIAGYGFADEHINRILFQSLDTNSTLQMLAVEPFGVVREQAQAEQSESVACQLAQDSDPRYSVLTGAAAKFENLWRCFPTNEALTPPTQPNATGFTPTPTRDNREDGS